jgi:hypothetical protein
VSSQRFFAFVIRLLLGDAVALSRTYDARALGRFYAWRRADETGRTNPTAAFAFAAYLVHRARPTEENRFTTQAHYLCSLFNRNNLQVARWRNPPKLFAGHRNAILKGLSDRWQSQRYAFVSKAGL